MKKYYQVLILAAVLFIPYFSYAQPVVYSWAKDMGGKTNYDGLLGLAKDASGNLYVTGTFTGSRTFGSFTLTAFGFSEVFVARYSPSGVCDWAVNAGSNFSSAFAGKIAVSGNKVYVTGAFTNILSFGAFAVSSYGNKDIFIAGLNATTGDCDWLEKAGGIFDDLGLSITPAVGGGTLVTGSFSDMATFGTLTVSSGSLVDRDIFYAKYNDAGTCLWVKRIGDTGTDISNVIKQMPSGDILMAGTYEGSVQFGPGVTLNSVGFSDIFLAKFNSTGSLIWAASAGGDNNDIAYDLDYNTAGDIYMTGLIGDTSNFGSIYVPNSGNIQVFTAKYSASGTPQWVRTGGNALDDIGYAISVDAGSSAYVTGYINGNGMFGTTPVTGVVSIDAFIAKYDPFGTLRWITRIGSGGFDQGKAIVSDVAGNCYAMGDFNSSATFGTTVLTAAGNDYEAYLTRVGGGSVGLEESDESHFSFYPNPTRDYITLNLSKIADLAFSLDIISIDGKLITSRIIEKAEAKSDFRLSLNDLAKGSYVVRISTSQGDFTRTLIVQ